MKFGKKLRETVHRSLPDWQTQFIDYKKLKKLLKSDLEDVLISEADEASFEDHTDVWWQTETHASTVEGRNGQRHHEAHALETDDAHCQVLTGMNDEKHSDPQVTNTEECVEGGTWTKRQRRTCSVPVDTDSDSELSDSPPQEVLEIANRSPVPRRKDDSGFFDLLHDELDKVNDFYVDRMEEYVIQCEMVIGRAKVALDEARNKARGSQQVLLSLKCQLVELRGEMALLQNYATVNYIGFRKALKKYDKKRGTHLRRTYLAGVLHTPFFLQSETLRHLIRDVDTRVGELAMRLEAFRTESGGQADSALTHDMNSQNKAHESIAKCPKGKRKVEASEANCYA